MTLFQQALYENRLKFFAMFFTSYSSCVKPDRNMLQFHAQWCQLRKDGNSSKYLFVEVTSMKKQAILLTVSLMFMATASAGGDKQPVVKPKPMPKPKPVVCKSISQIVAGDPQFNTLLTALKSADLVKTLDGKGAYTVFAPNNAAFKKVPSDKLANVLADKKALRDLLLYHVVNEAASSAVIKTFSSGTTMQGGDVTIKTSGNKIMINTANIVRADIKACNGMVHIIDTVLMPPPSQGKVELTKPKATKPPVTSTPVTSPKPEKKEEIKKVVEEVKKVEEVKEVKPLPKAADAKAEEVKVKEVEAVKTKTVETKAATKIENTATSDTIKIKDMPSASTVDLLAKDKRFSTLVSLIKKADLAKTIDSGEYTVFAPTNEAFDALPESALKALTNDPKALTNLLKGHVVKGKVSSKQMMDQEPLKNIEDGDLPLFNTYPATGYNTKTGMVYEVDSVLFASDFEMPSF